MRSTSNTRDNLDIPPVNASNQSEAGPSMSRHLIRQAQLPQITRNLSNAGPSNSRQVTIGEPQIQTGSPLSSSPKRQLTREELLSKIDKYSTKLREYAGNMTEKDKGKQKADSYVKSHHKMVSRLHGKILEQMLTITEKYNAKGFVYGMVTETSKPLTGASDSLRAWWKREAMFDKVGPVQIDQYYKDNSLNSHEPQDSETKSTTELLMELSDPTLGSILSLLMQDCDPPQRKFPYDNGVPPPWWPTTKEDWWGQTGISRDEGPPPFKKPHGLRKKWKAAVIVGIMKLMSPNYSRPYNLVEQSHHLKLRMNAKEKKFWTSALVAEAKQYCREHPDMPVDEAIAFVEACASSCSQIAPNMDRKNISVSANEAPGFTNPFGVMNWPPLALPSNTTSTWPTTVPPTGHLQQGVQVSSTAPDQQMTMRGGFAPQYQPWVFSYPPFVEQAGEAPSSSGTRDVQNQMHEYGTNMESGFEPSLGNRNSRSGH